LEPAANKIIQRIDRNDGRTRLSRQSTMSQGREEAAAEIVRNLLKNGMPVEQLSQITGLLSVEKIRSFIPGTSSAAK
jgi:hypothetical protein